MCSAPFPERPVTSKIWQMELVRFFFSRVSLWEDRLFFSVWEEAKHESRKGGDALLRAGVVNTLMFDDSSQRGESLSLLVVSLSLWHLHHATITFVSRANLKIIRPGVNLRPHRLDPSFRCVSRPHLINRDCTCHIVCVVTCWPWCRRLHVGSKIWLQTYYGSGSETARAQ